jgi:hypothetical protein
MFDRYVFVDYENVQDIKTEIITDSTKLMIIVGEEQSKVPIGLVQKTQPFGNSVEWVRVSGKGRNALDFFIAYFLGQYVALDKTKRFIIYSKDTGYDPLINYLKLNGINTERIVSYQELSDKVTIKIDENSIKKIRDNLYKVPANKRPKKRSSLTGHLKSLFLNGKNKEELEKLIEDMFIKKLIYEENGIIKYSLDE